LSFTSGSRGAIEARDRRFPVGGRAQTGFLTPVDRYQQSGSMAQRRPWLHRASGRWRVATRYYPDEETAWQALREHQGEQAAQQPAPPPPPLPPGDALSSTWWVAVAARAVEAIWSDPNVDALRRGRVVASLISSARNHAQQCELEQQLAAVEGRLAEMESAARRHVTYSSAADLRGAAGEEN